MPELSVQLKNPFFKAHRNTLVIFLMVLISIAVIYGIWCYFMNLQVANEQNQIIISRTNVAKLISTAVETKLSEKIKILEMEGDLPSVQNVMYANDINATIKGIPDNLDLEKRHSAQRILAFDKDFNVVFFLMPNGDMYIQEPYVDQINNNVLNFAFRDYYKGAIATHQTYVSEAYISQATDKKAVAISEPIYFGNGTLKGLWVGLINLDSLEKEISNLDLSQDRRIIITDQNGHSVIDTNDTQNDLDLLSYPGLQSVSDALAGKSGSIVEMVNGTKMFSVYQHVQIGSNRWSVVMMQPYEDTFGIISSTTESSYLMISLIISIIAVCGFFAYKLTRSNEILAKKLLEADVAKEEFSAMITHELKTPLVTINGYSEMLEGGILGPVNEKQVDAVKEIYSGSRRLENLITDIMDAQKLDLQKMRFKKADFAIDQLMASVFMHNLQLMKSKNIDFINSTEIKNTINSDRNRLEQVFSNTIKNSVDFVPDKNGRIEIGAENDDKNIIFHVKDNGVGIPKDKQKNLFKKFYQIDSTLKRKHGGSGLGLVICKGIVEALGGKIWFESEVGKGTTFWFSIPIHTLDIIKDS